MKELPDLLYDEILALSEQGNVFMDEGEYTKAVDIYRSALTKLPDPYVQWDAFVWLKASVGDAFFHLKQYGDAAEEFFDAMNGVDGSCNGFVLLRLGQCLYERAESNALNYLCKAYFLEGDDIFRSEDSKYIDAVKLALGGEAN